MAIFNGVVRAVYVIDSWHPAGSAAYTTRDATKLVRAGRWEFVGHAAGADMQQRYVGGLITTYFPQGLQSPVVYIQCP